MGRKLVKINYVMWKLFTVLIAAGLIFTGCEVEDVVSGAESIELSAETLVFNSEGGIQSIEINSSGNWRISGYSDWVKPLATEGASGDKLSFEAQPNNTEYAKEAVFKIFVGNAVSSLTIRSEVNYFIELISSEEVKLNSGKNSLKVEMKTNVSDLKIDYSDDGSEWITMSGKSEVFGKTVINFEISGNTSYKSRVSEITFSGNDRQGKVKIVQDKLDAVITENNKIVKGLEEGETELTVRSNIEYEISEMPEWLDMQLKSKGEIIDDDGLTTDIYTLKYKQASSSRIAEIRFEYNSITLLTVAFKQQVENPVLFQISDPGLRRYLSDLGWVIADSVSEDCEVLEPGSTAVELVLEEKSGQKIKIIDGLGAFPNLIALNFVLPSVESIDLSDCRQIKVMMLNGLKHISSINTGENPISNIEFNKENSDFISSSSLEISGDNVVNINISSDSWSIYYGEEKLEYLDVSNCPKLAVLNAQRECWGTSVLKTIYVSAAQKAAIDNGTLTVDKPEKTTIEVKE